MHRLEGNEMKSRDKIRKLLLIPLTTVITIILAAGIVVYADDFTYQKFASSLFITPYEYQAFVGDTMSFKKADAVADANVTSQLMNHYFQFQRSDSSSVANDSSQIESMPAEVKDGVISYKITQADAGKYLRVRIRPQTTTGTAYVSGWRYIPDNYCGAGFGQLNALWDYDPQTGVFTITGSGATRDYSSSDQTEVIYDDRRPWARNVIYNNVKSVKVAEGISTLGNHTFFKFSAMTSVTLPSSLKSLKESVFYSCTALTEVKLPEGLKEIGKSCFYNCTKLKKINIPASVTSIYSEDNGVFGKIASDHVISVYAGTAGSAYVRKKGLNGSFDLSTASITGVEDKTWAGADVTQQIEVKDNDTVLKEGTDYKVSYKDNNKAGLASLTITGIGKCTGSKTVQFSIMPAGPSAEPGLKYQNEPLSKVESRIVGVTANSDVEGAVYSILQAKVKKVNKRRLQLQWKPVEQADGYIVYGAMYNQAYQKLTEIYSGSASSFLVQDLKKGRYYKLIVVAYRGAGSGKQVLTTSKTVYAATTGGKFGNPKKVRIGQKKLTLRAGKKKKITSSVTNGPGKVKIRRKLSWESTNEAVARVNKNGRITAVSAGTCYVYAYAQNGIMARIRVTVK